MARSRNIKPTFFLNDKLADAPFETRLLFIGLWCVADRCGRLEDSPRKIKAQVLPYDDVDIDTMLDTLDDEFICRYEVDGKKYIQVLNFAKHQNPHKKEKESEIPCMPTESIGQAPYKPSTKPMQTPDKPDTSTMLAPGKHGASIEQASGKSDAKPVQALCINKDKNDLPMRVDNINLPETQSTSGFDGALYKPGANTVQAPYKHHASPVLVPEKDHTSPAESFNLNPDILNPDILINDNLNNNYDVKAVDVVVDTAFAELVKKYQNNIQSPIPPMSLEWLQQDYDEFGAEMMTYAIEQAVKNSARGYGYIQSIVSTWRARQIKTLSDAKADDDKYRQQRAPQQQQQLQEQPRKPRKRQNLAELKAKMDAELDALYGKKT